MGSLLPSCKTSQSTARRKQHIQQVVRGVVRRLCHTGMARSMARGKPVASG